MVEQCGKINALLNEDFGEDGWRPLLLHTGAFLVIPVCWQHHHAWRCYPLPTPISYYIMVIKIFVCPIQIPCHEKMLFCLTSGKDAGTGGFGGSAEPQLFRGGSLHPQLEHGK